MIQVRDPFYKPRILAKIATLHLLDRIAGWLVEHGYAKSHEQAQEQAAAMMTRAIYSLFSTEKEV